MANSVNICPMCEEELGKGVMVESVGSKICQKCFDQMFLCNACEDMFECDEGNTFEDDWYCDDCFSNRFFYCESCEEAVSNDNVCSTEGGDYYCGDCYYEIFMHCPICDCEVLREESYHSDYHDMYVCSDCIDNERDDVSLDTDYGCTVKPPVEGDTFSINKFERAAGVEIETTGSNSDDIRNDDYFSAFGITSDGSIESDSEYRGFEFVSKPMRGDHLFFEIDKICSYLLDNDFIVNRSCGLHVHIDARDLFYKDLRGIAVVMKSFEGVVFSMMPKSRIKSNWCKSMKMGKSEIIGIDSNEEFIQTWYDTCGESPSMNKYNDARYHGLNLHARVYLGTIEFRYHSGTNNPTKIKNWITICQSIVEKGIALGKVMDEAPEDWDSKTYKFMTEEDLGLADFIDMLELNDISQYIIERVRKFNNYPILTSVIDREYVINNFTSV